MGEGRGQAFCLYLDTFHRLYQPSILNSQLMASVPWEEGLRQSGGQQQPGFAQIWGYRYSSPQQQSLDTVWGYWELPERCVHADPVNVIFFPNSLWMQSTFTR